MRMASKFRFEMLRKKGGLSCIQVARILQHYLDDQLDESAAAQVGHHLDACRRCGLDAESYRDIKRGLAQSSHPPPPERVERLASFVAHLVSEGES